MHSYFEEFKIKIISLKLKYFTRRGTQTICQALSLSKIWYNYMQHKYL